MLKFFPVLLACLALAPHPSVYADANWPVLPLSADETAAIAQAQELGREIFLHDQAAALVSDEVVKLTAARAPRGMQGWVTQRHGQQLAVTFIATAADGGFEALYRGMVADGRLLDKVVELAPPQPLSEFEAAALAARKTAAASGFARCAARYNTVVLPGVAGGERQWSVYLLPGTTRKDLVPLGGSYRVETDFSGTKLVAIHPYTRSCLQLQREPSAVAMMTTHLLHSVPTDVHVYWQLWSRMPLIVATQPEAVWALAEGKITLMKRGDSAQQTK
ncbi:hypothetical protein [Massilia sp. BJB1822]|uniref:hypothetical protein n=1 Tax=Massilia sp. BJB1822 TaxID=2744470 RepID=UPI001592DF92|nr:hypothetical protein [Massilia sp. BJB1822]NVD96492.1 hypothetical protein [Massilia sp. BJB1822]